MPPEFTSIAECATCGQPAEADAASCAVCAGDQFRTRYRCPSCDKLLTSPECADCVPEATTSPPTFRGLPTAADEVPDDCAAYVRKGAWYGFVVGGFTACIRLSAFDGDDAAGSFTALFTMVLGALAGYVVMRRVTSLGHVIVAAPVALGFLGLWLGTLLAEAANRSGYLIVGPVTGGAFGFLVWAFKRAQDPERGPFKGWDDVPR